MPPEELILEETASERASATFTVTDTRAPEVDDEHEDEPRQRAHRPTYSGWCGPGPCRDGGLKDANGGRKRHCKGSMTNGARVIPRVVNCACVCHSDPVLTDPEQTKYPAVANTADNRTL